jgi:hypothetical protein
MYSLHSILTPIGSRQIGRYGLVFENKSNKRHVGITIADIKKWQWETNNLAEIIFLDNQSKERTIFLQESRRDYEILKAYGMFQKHSHKENISQDSNQYSLFI